MKTNNESDKGKQHGLQEKIRRNSWSKRYEKWTKEVTKTVVCTAIMISTCVFFGQPIILLFRNVLEGVKTLIENFF